MPRTVFVFHSVLNSDAVSDALLRSIDSEVSALDVLPWFVRMMWKGRSGRVRGRVERNTFRLKKWSAWQFSPSFYGKWESQYGGTRIEGYFDLDSVARWSSRLTTVLLLSFAAIGITLNTLDLKARTHFTVDPKIGLVISILFVPVAVGIYLIAGVLGSRRDKRLVEFLERTLIAVRDDENYRERI
jgi:hypothetical protein